MTGMKKERGSLSCLLSWLQVKQVKLIERKLFLINKLNEKILIYILYIVTCRVYIDYIFLNNIFL